jgi:hypothetical protein
MKYFGKMRAFIGLQVKRFQKGQYIELPGVLNYPFDEASQTSQPPTGPYRRNGMSFGKSKDYLHCIVAELEDRDGKIYQRKIISFSWYEYEKNEDGSNGNTRPNIWNDYLKAEFLKLSQPERYKIANTGNASFENPDSPESWAYVMFNLLPTGYTYQYDTKKYFANISLFNTEQEMRKAEKERQSQFNGNDQKDYSHYPQMWQSKPEALAKFAQKQSDQGKSYREIAIACKLMNENGTPADNANGSKIDVVALIAQLLNVPEPMVTLE